MCEGHCTGIPTIPIHPRFLEKKDVDQTESDDTNIGDSIGEKSADNQTIGAIRLNKNQRRIVEMLRQNPYLTGAELAEEIGILGVYGQTIVYTTI